MAHKNKSKSWRTRTSRGGLYKSEKSGTTPNISISASKAHMCMFCEQQFQKLSRHQRRHHKEEPSVAAGMTWRMAQMRKFWRLRRFVFLGITTTIATCWRLERGSWLWCESPANQHHRQNFCLVPIASVFSKATSFGGIASSASTRPPPKKKNGRNFKLRQSFSFRRVSSQLQT